MLPADFTTGQKNWLSANPILNYAWCNQIWIFSAFAFLDSIDKILKQ